MDASDDSAFSPRSSLCASSMYMTVQAARDELDQAMTASRVNKKRRNIIDLPVTSSSQHSFAAPPLWITAPPLSGTSSDGSHRCVHPTPAIAPAAHCAHCAFCSMCQLPGASAYRPHSRVATWRVSAM